MSEMLSIIARIEAKKSKVEQVKSEVIKLIKPTRNEEGCIYYVLHQDDEQAGVFVFFEKWKNKESCEKHMKSPHAKIFLKAVDGLLANLTINKMTEIG